MPKNALGARKNGRFKAVCTAPSFNKTPVGNSTPPLPYPTTQDLGNSAGVTPTVKFNGDPAYVLDGSTQPSCKGDNPGTAKGVKSGTVNGEVKPVKASGTVRAEGKAVVRVGDANTMNGGNNPGIYVPQPAPGTSQPRAAPAVEPAPKPAQDDWLRNAAQYYQDNVSEAAHEFAGRALDTGGTLAAGGGAAAAVGGGMVATGVGAVPGAAVATAGAATAAVGGGVAGVGSVVETAAVGLDRAADFILTGKMPNVLGAAAELAQNLVLDRVTRFIPGRKRKAPARSEKSAAPPAKKPKLADGGSDGVGVAGSGKGGEDCGIKPYKDQKCPKGQQAHHIVPDYALRYGSRGKGAKGAERIAGMPSLADGPSICLSGGSKTEGSDHNAAHKGTDPRVKAAGERSDNGPLGVAPIGEIIQISIEEVSSVKPHCGEEIQRKVDEAFKDVDRSKYGRTTQQPPKKGTEAHGALERGETHQRGRRKRGR